MRRKYSLIIIGILLIAVFIIINVALSSKNRNRVRLLNDSAGYCYSIEKAVVNNDELCLDGFFFEMKKIQNVEQLNYESKGISLVLLDTEVKKQVDEEYEKNTNFEHEAEVIPPKYDGIAMDILYKTRDDVNSYFSCEYDYSESGFRAIVNTKKLDLEHKTYQVCIKLDWRYENAVATNYYIQNGKLVNINPEDYIVLDVESTDLEKIVKNGDYLASSSLCGVSVYQYDNDLYWIADPNVLVRPDKETFIELHVETTQFDKLPDIRLQGGYFYDNIGANFEEYEVTSEMNCGKYRVSKRPVPQDYSVVLLTTGYYENGTWVWRSIFRPKYSFNN